VGHFFGWGEVCRDTKEPSLNAGESVQGGGRPEGGVVPMLREEHQCIQNGKGGVPGVRRLGTGSNNAEMTRLGLKKFGLNMALGPLKQFGEKVPSPKKKKIILEAKRQKIKKIGSGIFTQD